MFRKSLNQQTTGSDQSEPLQKRGKLTYAEEDDPLIKRLIIEIIERATGRKKLERVYNEIYDLDYLRAATEKLENSSAN
ncbi:MAG: hypothetical protein DHS20C18_55400 [Saprospiraceae bacterium]|nr:MAG: hypothetical protein DHS20C18_55400 [Saprospiraceae bacterium]